jgi:hypothetical protein
MAVNFSTMVYGPAQEQFGRPVNFTSTLGNSFTGPGRGIYDSRVLTVALEDGSVITDQETILDIRASEFAVLPMQGDTIDIPYEQTSQLEALGKFEIINRSDNGGGETTLTLRKMLS